ncbi:MAG: capsid protein [Cressdnaviricota sp.]|nr:MAG: capsid protein [Cressdnaviricota sp.]
MTSRRNQLVRSNFGQAASLASYAGRMAGKFTQRKITSYRNKRSVKSDSTPSGVQTQNPVTFQRDSISTYRRRTAPRRVRKRAARRQNQFESSLARTLGLKSLVTNAYNGINVNANSQGWVDIPFVDRNTVAKLFGAFQVDGAIAAQTTFSLNQPTVEIIIKSYRCEVELNNTSANLMYVDMYYYYPRKDYATGVQTSIGEIGTTASLTGATISNANVITNNAPFETLGMTPFNVPSFTENFVVYRTRRVMLQANQSFTFSQSARKMGNQSNRDWIGVQVRRNITTGVLIVASGAVATAGTSTGLIAIHKQEWVSSYKNGGLGSQSTVVNYPGQ